MKSWIIAAACALPLLLGACTPIAETNDAVAQSLTSFKNDTGGAWKNLFTYNPKPKTPQPAATRYCYQFSGDIVCYDSPQPHTTAKLVGVQGSEGPRMIVYQTNNDMALGYDATAPAVSAPVPSQLPMDTGQPFTASSGAVNGKVIQSQDIPPPTKK